MTEAEFAEAGIADDLLHIECPLSFYDDYRIEVSFVGPFTDWARYPCTPHSFLTNAHTGDSPTSKRLASLIRHTVREPQSGTW
jgi:hypothetical protein